MIFYFVHCSDCCCFAQNGTIVLTTIVVATSTNFSPKIVRQNRLVIYSTGTDVITSISTQKFHLFHARFLSTSPSEKYTKSIELKKIEF